MHHPTFTIPHLTTFCRLDELGLEAVGQLLEPDRAVLECRVVDDDPRCRKCGPEGVVRDTVARPLAHEPVRAQANETPDPGASGPVQSLPAHLAVGHAQGGVAEGEDLPRRDRGALTAIVVDHLTVSRAAAGLGVSWHTPNTAKLVERRRRHIDDPTRSDGVTTLGVDEHVGSVR